MIQLEQDPVHARVLLLELLPEILESHVALLHLVLVSGEVDVLRSDVEDVFVRSVAPRSTVQFPDDDVLCHLLEGVDLETDVRSLLLTTTEKLLLRRTHELERK